MSLSLSIFLYVYFFAVLVFALGSIFVLYHLLRFGFNKTLVSICSIAYIFVTAVILITTAYYALQIDWSTPIDFSFKIF